MADAQIFADLKADHDRHRVLLQQMGAATDGGERAALFDAFRVEVGAHAAAEEESLYATMLAKPDLREDAVHSVSEHKEIGDLLGELAGLDAASPDWTAKFKELRHDYEHHIDEEEAEMFPAAAEELSDAEEEQLAAVFEDRKPAELVRAEQHPPGSDERE